MVLGIVTKRGSSGLSPLRPGGSSDGKAGRLDHVSGGQKTLRTMLNLKRDFQARVHSGQMVLMVVRKRGWTAWAVAKDIQIESEKGSRQLGNLLKNRQIDSPKKSQPTLSQGMLTRWDDVDVDYELRTTVPSQNRAIATLSRINFPPDSVFTV